MKHNSKSTKCSALVSTVVETVGFYSLVAASCSHIICRFLWQFQASDCLAVAAPCAGQGAGDFQYWQALTPRCLAVALVDVKEIQKGQRLIYKILAGSKFLTSI